MAKQIKKDQFLLIECTAKELMDAVGSDICICDQCARHCARTEKGVYIAVLNMWFCQECFEKWINRAHWYPEDASVERKNFDFYAQRFGLKCQ